MTIKQLRDRIDKIDGDIIKKLSQRKKISLKIGKIKAGHHKKIVDPTREEKMFIRYEKLCTEYDVQSDFIKKLFKMIISNSRKLQK